MPYLQHQATNSRICGAWSLRRLLAAAVILAASLFAPGCVSPPVYKPATSAPTNTSTGYSREQYQASKSTNRVAATGMPRQRAVWLGVAATVVASELGERFPILSGDGTEAGANKVFAELNQRIWSSLSNHLGSAGAFPGIELVELGQDRDTDLGMALLLNKERWREELTFEGKYRREYGILGQLVFIDQKKSELVASYPIGNRIAMISDAKASDQERSLMANGTLIGEADGASGKDSILHQFLKSIESSSVNPKPDYCLEVGKVLFSEACANPSYSGSKKDQIKSLQLNPDELATWASEVGPILVNHLGNGTGHVFNPFVAKKTGKDNLISLNFLKGSPKVVNQKGPLSLRLPDPARRFDLEIEALSCEVDDEFTGKYVVNLVYGFRGTMTMYSADGVAVFSHPFDISLSGFKSLRKEQREQYWKNARRKLLPAQFEGGNYDPIWSWQNSVDNFLDQLALEMFFPKADVAARFKPVRDSLGGIHAAIR